MINHEKPLECEQDTSKINRKKLLLYFAVSLAILLCMTICIYAFNPSIQLKKHLQNENYVRAVQVYNKHLSNKSNKSEYINLFSEHITSIDTSWSEEKLDYKKAADFLGAIHKIDDPNLAKLAADKREHILIEGQGKELLTNAESHYADNKHIDAMAAIKKIDTKFSQFEYAQALYDLCKDFILDQVSGSTTVDAFEKNINLMEKYLKKVNDPNFQAKKKSLEKDLSILKEVLKMIETAESLYNEGKYKDAFSTLNKGLEKYPDNKELSASLSVLHEMYVVLIAQQIKGACEKEDYSAALTIVDNAIAAHDCDEFQMLKESIKEQKSWLYRTAKSIKEKFSALVSGWNKEDFDVKKASSDAGAYIVKSGKKIVLGDYADEDITVLSMTGNVVASIANFDVLFDVRDLVYDIQHMGQDKYFVAHLAVDVIALIPVIGVVKYLKYTDDVADGVKTTSKVIEQVADAGKTTDKVADAIDTIKTADKIADAVDTASDAAKASDAIADTTQDIAKTLAKYDDLEGTVKKGVKYVRKKLTYSDGKVIEGVFPAFKSKFSYNLSPEFYKSTAQTHKKHANKALLEQIENNKWLASKFNKQQLTDIKAGKTPTGYTWHHSETEGVLQLVKTKTHDAVKHMGGMSLWGRGYNN